MSWIKLIGGVFVFILAALAAFFLFGRGAPGGGPEVPGSTGFFSSFFRSGDSPMPSGPESRADSGRIRFVHPGRGFSLDLPGGFATSSIPDDRGELLMFQRGPRESFQIYIAPFDEEGPLSVERIRRDLPSLTMADARTIELDSVPAVVFQSADESLASRELGTSGKTFEVWFVYPESPLPDGNDLYQIMTYAEYGDDLIRILKTWRFERR